MITTAVFIYSKTPPHSLLRTIITDDADHPGVDVTARPSCVPQAGEAHIVMPYVEFQTLTIPLESDPKLLAAIAAHVAAVP